MPVRDIARLAVLLVALLVSVAARLPAQYVTVVPAVQREWRLEAAIAREPSALIMAGANVPMGFYVRSGLAVGVGVVGSGHSARLAQRADVTMRFLLDPFAETRWGPYAGGGLTVRRNGADRAAAGLLLVLGVEGARDARWRPAVELALGEGVRAAVVFRRARETGR